MKKSVYLRVSPESGRGEAPVRICGPFLHQVIVPKINLFYSKVIVFVMFLVIFFIITIITIIIIISTIIIIIGTLFIIGGGSTITWDLCTTLRPIQRLLFSPRKICFHTWWKPLTFPTGAAFIKIPSEMEVAPPHKRFTQFSALIKL